MRKKLKREKSESYGLVKIWQRGRGDPVVGRGVRIGETIVSTPKNGRPKNGYIGGISGNGCPINTFQDYYSHPGRPFLGVGVTQKI